MNVSVPVQPASKQNVGVSVPPPDLTYGLQLVAGVPGADHFGVSPHTDFGCMTLLYQDMTGGLRVQGRRGEWLTAHPIEGTLVVNVGDLLARWTNDRFQSTRHAVVNTSGAERLSIPVAVDPNWETAIDPVTLAGENAHYPSVRCGDYIVGRFDKSFAYRQQD